MTLHLDSALLAHAHDAFDYLIEDGGLLGALESVRGFEDVNFLDFVVHEPHVTVVTNSTTTTKETLTISGLHCISQHIYRTPH